jgi:hypothetical protein
MGMDSLGAFQKRHGGCGHEMTQQLLANTAGKNGDKQLIMDLMVQATAGQMSLAGGVESLI